MVLANERKLEQLERLRSEDTPRRPMITPYYWPVYFESQVHIIDQIPSQNKVKAEKFAKKNFVINLTLDTPSNGSDYLWQTWK